MCSCLGSHILCMILNCLSCCFLCSVSCILIYILRCSTLQCCVQRSLQGIQLGRFHRCGFSKSVQQIYKEGKRCNIVQFGAFLFQIQYQFLYFFTSIIQTTLYCIITYLQYRSNFLYRHVLIIEHSQDYSLIFRQLVQNLHHQTADFLFIHCQLRILVNTVSFYILLKGQSLCFFISLIACHSCKKHRLTFLQPVLG